MYNHLQPLVKTCAQTNGFYPRYVLDNVAVENRNGLYKHYRIVLHTFLDTFFSLFLSHTESFYTLSSGPITNTTNNIKKGYY